MVVLESLFIDLFLIFSFLRSYFQCLIAGRIVATCRRWAVVENPNFLKHPLPPLTPQHRERRLLGHLRALPLISTVEGGRVLTCAISLGKNRYCQAASGPAWPALIPGLCLERLGFPWSIFGLCLLMVQNCRLLYQPTR